MKKINIDDLIFLLDKNNDVLLNELDDFVNYLKDEIEEEEDEDDECEDESEFVISENCEICDTIKKIKLADFEEAHRILSEFIFSF